MTFTSPETLNRRLAAAQFLTHPADQVFFQDMINRIRSMAERHKREVERFIPDIREAGAWAKAYEIYEALVQLDNAPPDPAAIAPGIARAAREKRWNQFIQQREILVGLVQRGELSRQRREYIGLEEGDLGPPTTDDSEAMNYNDGKRLDWREVAFRINQALCRWEEMQPGEKAAIPLVMAARRAEAANKEFSIRLSAVEGQATTEATAA